jgi:origin recognition complex subunit 1
MDQSSGQHRITKVEKARKYLTSGGVCREDSDDELGLEDHPWEWVYGNEKEKVCDSVVNKTRSTEVSHLALKGRRRRTCSGNVPDKTIIGARMGKFECKVGDSVLLKADGTKEAWVGLICEFMNDDDEGMVANFMWFSTEKEIRNKEKKRKDFMQNELYITPSWDINPLASINGKARITSAEAYLAKYPSGRIPRGSKDYGKTFICRRGCDTRSTTYTAEFVWEDVFRGAEADIYSLIERIKSETKPTRKRRYDRSAIDDGDEFTVGNGQNFTHETPTKKQKTSVTYTPRKLQSQPKLVTPTHKRLDTSTLEPQHIRETRKFARISANNI